MMGMALTGKWSTPDQFQSTVTQPHTPETVEAEVVEPEAGSQKQRTLMWTFCFPSCSLMFFISVLLTGEVVFLKNIGIGSYILQISRGIQWSCYTSGSTYN